MRKIRTFSGKTKDLTDPTKNRYFIIAVTLNPFPDEAETWELHVMTKVYDKPELEVQDIGNKNYKKYAVVVAVWGNRTLARGA